MNKANKIVLGIDPGTARMGYGVLRHTTGQNPQIIDYGTLTTKAKTDEHLRLASLSQDLDNILKKHNPDVVAVEDIFYAHNQKTVVQVAQARGVALLAAAQKQKLCYSFTPLQVKQAVAGYGQADKKQVQKMVQSLLSLEEVPKPDDAADALAVAICCAHSLPVLEQTQQT